MKGPSESEHSIQCDFVTQARQKKRDDVFFFAVPNGGLRNGRVAMQMKNEGLMPGVADICFMLPGGRTAWLEMKKPGGALSDHQHGFKAWCDRLGHHWGLARSVEEGLQHLASWGALK